MNKKILLPVAILFLAALACNVPTTATTPAAPTLAGSTLAGPTETPVPPVPTNTVPVPATDTPLPPEPTSTTAAATSTPTGLTLAILKNATFHTPAYDRTVTLVDGAYSEGSGANTFSVQMLDVYALGDLNGDGRPDAAVFLAENGGGSGQFESVIAVVDQGGKPHQMSEASLGDRVLIKSADISSGVIHLDMVVQGPNDPMCCPSLQQQQNYWLIDNKLWLMRVASTINGTVHSINIDSPGIWTTMNNPFKVTGSVSVLPFENTLSYRIYLTDGTKVNESPQMVTPTTGTAGTFQRTVDLSAAGINDWVILQFVDVSAADGSTIALGSVILKVK